MSFYFQQSDFARPVFDGYDISMSNGRGHIYKFNIFIPDKISNLEDKIFDSFQNGRNIYIEYHKTRATLVLGKNKVVSYIYNGCGQIVKHAATEALLSFLLYPIAYDKSDRPYLNDNRSRLGYIKMYDTDLKIHLHLEFIKNYQEFLEGCLDTLRRMDSGYEKFYKCLNSYVLYYHYVLPLIKEEFNS